MTKPTPEPIDPEQLVELALAVVKADRFPVLATIDGDQPRVRPVSPVRTDGFTVYVANLRNYHKTAEIAANPRVELCYLDDHHDQVRITGVAEVVTEPNLLQSIWDANPLLRQYLPAVDAQLAPGAASSAAEAILSQAVEAVADRYWRACRDGRGEGT